jgi:hypothetical protein
MNTTDGVVDWKTVWTYPAVFAGVVMVAFFLLFWDRLREPAGEGEVANAMAWEENP